MTKIEEILNRNFELAFINDNKCEPDIESLRDAVATGLDYETLINSIKEYAEYYAKRFRTEIKDCISTDDYLGLLQQIDNTKLPDHE